MFADIQACQHFLLPISLQSMTFPLLSYRRGFSFVEFQIGLSVALSYPIEAY